MLFDRQDNRKQRELAYRSELKEQVDHKSRLIMKPQEGYHPEKQAFSLITNIEKQQEERKRKNQDYYDQLRRQIEIERVNKKNAEADKKRKELEEENKLQEQQKRLRERYAQEMRKEKGKGKPIPEISPVINNPQKSNPEPQPFYDKRNSEVRRPSHTEGNLQRSEHLSQVYMSSSDEELAPLQVAHSLYPNRVENETFNYAPRKQYRDNYYKELLGQRRQLDEQTSQIAQMNRVFHFEQYRKKEESRGLQQLRSLHRMLDDKNGEYMGLERSLGGRPERQEKPERREYKSNIRVSRALGSSQKGNHDEWRKLD